MEISEKKETTKEIGCEVKQRFNIILKSVFYWQ